MIINNNPPMEWDKVIEMNRFRLLLLVMLAVTGLGVSSSAIANAYYGEHLCAYKNDFKCERVLSGETWEKRFPNEYQRSIVKRLNRTNMPLKYWRWIVIPTNLHQLSYMDLSPFPDQVPPEGKGKKSFLIIDLKQHAFGAFDKSGRLLHWGPISGGKGFCKDTGEYCKTVVGSYRITRKQGIGCTSSRFPIETDGGAAMPYCMHFYRGFALHGSNLPGRHASHGCVRLFVEDAHWLNKTFADIGTPVIVRPYH